MRERSDVVQAMCVHDPLHHGGFTTVTLPIKLNFGSGTRRHRDGYVNLDADPRTRPDICATVPPIPLPDESCETVFSSHMLEHLTSEDASALIAEVWRVLVVGGTAEIVVPYVMSHSAWQDPTHKSFYTGEGFLYYTPHFAYLGYPLERRFQLDSWDLAAGPAGVTIDGEVRVTLRKIEGLDEPCACPICRAQKEAM